MIFSTGEIESLFLKSIRTVRKKLSNEDFLVSVDRLGDDVEELAGLSLEFLSVRVGLNGSSVLINNGLFTFLIIIIILLSGEIACWLHESTTTVLVEIAHLLGSGKGSEGIESQ